MTKYEYKGKEDKVYTDCTGQIFYLKEGTVFEPKLKPEWESIEEYKEKKVKTNDSNR